MGNVVISPSEVKKYYVLSDLLGKKFRRQNPSPSEVVSAYKELRGYLEGAGAERIAELFELRREHVNHGLYEPLNWSFEEVALDDSNPCPGMCEISHRFTEGSIVETGNLLRAYREGRLPFDLDPSEKENLDRLLLKLDSMRPLMTFLQGNLPLILISGGVKKHPSLESRVPPVKRLTSDYELDDGNTRALLYTSNGVSSASAFVGRK